MKTNIGIIYGGKSVEHDISIISAILIMNILSNKYHIIPIYLNKENNLYIGKNLNNLESYQKITNKPLKTRQIFFNSRNISRSIKKFVKQRKIDLIWPIVHGQGVEDGTIQAVCDFYQIPIIASNHTSSAIAQDKAFTKIVLESFNIPVLESIVKYDNNYDSEDINYPVIIKPAHLGSSIGISIASNEDEYLEGIKLAYKYDNKVLIEPLLKSFNEYACAVYGINNEYYVSNIEDIKLVKEINDFSHKYLENSGSKLNNERMIINKKEALKHPIYQKIIEYTSRVYQALELKGIVRVDFLFDNTNNKLYVNEVNTIPGSLAYYLFETSEFEEILDQVVKEGIMTNENKQNKISSFESSVLNRKYHFKK